MAVIDCLVNPTNFEERVIKILLEFISKVQINLQMAQNEMFKNVEHL